MTAQIKKAKALREEGRSFQEISQELGISIATAWRWSSEAVTKGKTKSPKRRLIEELLICSSYSQTEIARRAEVTKQYVSLIAKESGVV